MEKKKKSIINPLTSIDDVLLMEIVEQKWRSGAFFIKDCSSICTGLVILRFLPFFFKRILSSHQLAIVTLTLFQFQDYTVTHLKYLFIIQCVAPCPFNKNAHLVKSLLYEIIFNSVCFCIFFLCLLKKKKYFLHIIKLCLKPFYWR